MAVPELDLSGTIHIGSLLADAASISGGGSSATQTVTTQLNLAPKAVTASTTQSLVGGQTAKLSAPVCIVNAANASDAVGLPVAATGSGCTILVISIGSTATLTIYPQNTSDAIDAASAGAAVTLTAAHRAAWFVDVAANQWRSFLLGAVST